MQNDQVVWDVISKSFCSFKVKTLTQQFCRHELNVTGFCSRQSCPLANSQYATVREVDGINYLYLKTVERAHTPSKVWERIKLSNQYVTALGQIDQELQYWPQFLKLKCKQRLTKLVQSQIRIRKLKLKLNQTKLVTISKKIDRRESKRELKAQTTAHLDRVIAGELVDRLKSGMYDDIILNSKSKVWSRLLQSRNVTVDVSDDEMEVDQDWVEPYVEAEDDADFGQRDFVHMSDDESDMEDLLDGSDESDDPHSSDSSVTGDQLLPASSSHPSKPKRPDPKKLRKHRQIEIEYEYENNHRALLPTP